MARCVGALARLEQCWFGGLLAQFGTSDRSARTIAAVYCCGYVHGN
ncbi:MAG: hypothetical protein HC925_06165 [Coleofasciculaceae cyanobacterium SM2_3_26]|nr:hypothetical protein [Coleofasciculaceae cyanobacterium SM2_3_26]